MSKRKWWHPIVHPVGEGADRHDEYEWEDDPQDVMEAMWEVIERQKEQLNDGETPCPFTVGWSWAYVRSLADDHIDVRTIELPEMFEEASRAFAMQGDS